MRYTLGVLLSGILTISSLFMGETVAFAAKSKRAGIAAARYAMLQVGDRYRMGAIGPSVWDCSGLVGGSWRRQGVKLPRTTRGLKHVGRPVRRSQLRPGDIVFTSPGHVQIYIGGGQVVEAANPRRGVVRTKMWGFYAARRP